MYHSISEGAENDRHPYYRTRTTPEIFTAQMRFLKEQHYTVLPLKEVKSYLEGREQVSGKLVAITFDDGFKDFYTEAFPVMQKCGFTGTVFLPTSFIGSSDLSLNGIKHLTWEEVRELHRYGIEFGSHTMTHPTLSLLKKEDVKAELRGSKEAIEDKLGVGVESFSYPFAFPEEDKNFIRFLRETLEKYGYNYGVSTMLGRVSIGDNGYFMKRLPVNSCDDPLLFKAKLEGGYDWLSVPQKMFKITKRMMPGRNKQLRQTNGL